MGSYSVSCHGPVAYVAKEKIEKQMSRLSSQRQTAAISSKFVGHRVWHFFDAIYVGTALKCEAVPTTKLIIFCPSANALIICCS